MLTLDMGISGAVYEDIDLISSQPHLPAAAH